MKTIAVIAANGRSGTVFVKAALEKGYKVKAGAHAKADFPRHENLEIVECNALNYNDVKNLVDSSDVVVSLIGHGRSSPPDLQTNAIKNVLRAMNECGISRVISLTGTGVRMPGDKIHLVDKFANIAIRLIDPARIKDGIRHVEILQQSGADWTVVRVLKLSNQTSNKRPRLSLHGPVEFFTPRQRVAEAILYSIEENAYIQQAPIVTQ